MTGEEHMFGKEKHCALNGSLEGKRLLWRPWSRQEDEIEAFLQKNLVWKKFLQTHNVGVFVFD
jgi:hypothetical protein